MVASLSQGLGAVECRTAHLIQGGDRVIQRRLALATRANLPPYSHCLRPVLSPQPQQSGGSDDASQGSSRRRRQLAPRLCSPNVFSLMRVGPLAEGARRGPPRLVCLADPADPELYPGARTARRYRVFVACLRLATRFACNGGCPKDRFADISGRSPIGLSALDGLDSA